MLKQSVYLFFLTIIFTSCFRQEEYKKFRKKKIVKTVTVFEPIHSFDTSPEKFEEDVSLKGKVKTVYKGGYNPPIKYKFDTNGFIIESRTYYGKRKDKLSCINTYKRDEKGNVLTKYKLHENSKRFDSNKVPQDWRFYSDEFKDTLYVRDKKVYKYDSANNMIQKTTFDDYDVKSRDNYYYKYDSSNMIIQRAIFHGDNVNRKATYYEYEYDSLGDIKKVSNRQFTIPDLDSAYYFGHQVYKNGKVIEVIKGDLKVLYSYNKSGEIDLKKYYSKKDKTNWVEIKINNDTIDQAYHVLYGQHMRYDYHYYSDTTIKMTITRLVRTRENRRIGLKSSEYYLYKDYYFDKFNRIIACVQRGRDKSYYVYDEKGRLIEFYDKSGFFENTYRYNYSVDSVGNWIQIKVNVAGDNRYNFIIKRKIEYYNL